MSIQNISCTCAIRTATQKSNKPQKNRAKARFFYILRAALDNSAQTVYNYDSTDLRSPQTASRPPIPMMQTATAQVRRRGLSPPPIPDNGVVQGGRSGENRPVYSTPNSFYSTSKGQHVYVYDGDGKLTYDLSPKRIKCFAINTSHSGKEYFNSGEKINRQYSRVH